MKKNNLEFEPIQLKRANKYVFITLQNIKATHKKRRFVWLKKIMKVFTQG